MVEQISKGIKGKRVFVTGHTGFKGVWLNAMLQYLGAETFGFAFPPDTSPSHYHLLPHNSKECIGDINHSLELEKSISQFKPHLIIHMAAQSLVRRSYSHPLDTYQTNVMGSLNVLHAARKSPDVMAVLMVTTDKVYENLEKDYAYTEYDRLGGYDMYSSSKACCEILTDSYRRSFYPVEEFEKSHQVLIASARSGNVIAGGDWNVDRLIPDLVKTVNSGQTVAIRNPLSVRPWQHVLDCLSGYLLLSVKLLNREISYAEAWNFAPYPEDCMNVGDLVSSCKLAWDKIQYKIQTDHLAPHEAGMLKLDHTKALHKLGWKPQLRLNEAIQWTIDWYRSYYESDQILTLQQIDQYFKK